MFVNITESKLIAYEILLASCKCSFRFHFRTTEIRTAVVMKGGLAVGVSARLDEGGRASRSGCIPMVPKRGAFELRGTES